MMNSVDVHLAARAGPSSALVRQEASLQTTNIQNQLTRVASRLDQQLDHDMNIEDILLFLEYTQRISNE